jgi:hypothetical protein
VQFKAISWNLFHGRDFPPDPALFTWRSRLLRRTERNETHVQVNRNLQDEFVTFLAAAKWDVALLQECPPRWAASLAHACNAEAHRALTSRNSLAPLRSLAARLNPDLIASGEGGSNLTLVRASATRPASDPNTGLDAGRVHDVERGRIVERRELEIHTGRPERRAMALTRIATSTGEGLCIANLHATNRGPLAIEDVRRAAEAAGEWAGEAPLLFGGDLNLRPAQSAAIFAELRERFGLTGPTDPRAIDHLLVRNLETIEAPHQWPPERHELHEGGLVLRLSDHAPVEAMFRDSASTVVA